MISSAAPGPAHGNAGGGAAPALDIRDLRFGWSDAAGPVLDIGRLRIEAGQTVFLHGPSGCGKSTLLSAIAGVVDVPTGTVSVGGTDIGALSGAARDQRRADQLGIVFQVFNLVPYLNVLDNVLLPCRFSDRRNERAGGPDAPATAKRLLAALGLGDARMLTRRPGDLSVGQQQRVAAARALIGTPGLVLADEPTSALDADLKSEFMTLFLGECARQNAAVLFVSHDRGLEGRFDRSIDLADLNHAFSARAGDAPC